MSSLVREEPKATLQLKGTLMVHIGAEGTPDGLKLATELAKRSSAALVSQQKP